MKNKDTNIRIESLGDELINAIPELIDEYKENRQFYSKDAFKDHLIYGHVLNPSLMRWLEEDNNPELLTRVFDHLEDLAQSSDPAIRNVVTVTVCERIDSSERALNVAQKYMGPNTRKLADAIAEYWSSQ